MGGCDARVEDYTAFFLGKTVPVGCESADTEPFGARTSGIDPVGGGPGEIRVVGVGIVLKVIILNIVKVFYWMVDDRLLLWDLVEQN